VAIYSGSQKDSRTLLGFSPRVHLVLANMFVGAKHDRSQYGIITNNLYAVMLLQASKTRCTLRRYEIVALFYGFFIATHPTSKVVIFWYLIYNYF
jgi:hypothetical protein